jgi:hypothetical protein
METTIYKQEQMDGTFIDFVIINRGNGEFTSMLKSTYDAMQAEQSTPMVTDEAATL